ncbi:MAG: ribosome biogenesis GTPase RsgA [Spiroplasma poulsonii]|uniref:Ribosome biogenesis GTPase A n=1 Tax=Spiroplasma poulsonii TaxID=2138 RepID=A0A2P6FBF7_9MOLU|nr:MULTISPECIES: ribosome biogenesis GTPase RsgA [Spiroplasma]KAF0851195.1 Ribosome biogenesis GTPase A [Spiroplasma poulsonii]MBH8622366.1 ribosome biogenesis GTPase RsgA [Spiroplasma sp. hyd1]MBW1241504.1 ribosome biogenesis GTPase RsgA [Spiroplasma poulsonii]PQM30789.1 Ribosome biogenesis GTPase A [Spiroplasma poulsonii]PWF95778.1 Ribosome biogenesis GTPase A [Spiroplasma poulsonii]
MCDKTIAIPSEFIKNNKRVDKLAATADVIIEVVDARVAYSGANLLNYAKLEHVKRIILFSNTQKADVEQTKKWMKYYYGQGIYCQMLLSPDQQSEEQYQQCLKGFHAFLKDYVDKKILIISLPHSNKEILLAKLFNNSESFEKAKLALFGREKVHRYNNVEFIDTAPITGVNFKTPNVYWNTQILGIFNIEENTEVVAIKAFKLLLTKYQAKLETAYSVNVQLKSSVDELVKEFIKLKSANVSLPEGETTDNLLLCADFLADLQNGKKIPAISLEWVEDYFK